MEVISNDLILFFASAIVVVFGSVILLFGVACIISITQSIIELFRPEDKFIYDKFGHKKE